MATRMAQGLAVGLFEGKDMRTVDGLISIIFALTAIAATAQTTSPAARTVPDERYRIATYLYGTRLDGAQEKSVRAAGKTRSQVNAILDEPLPALKYGQSVQLTVKVQLPGSSTFTDFTGSKRVTYYSAGCLTISSTGLVTAVPTDDCDITTNVAPLYVIFNDESGSALTYNMYMFDITR